MKIYSHVVWRIKNKMFLVRGVVFLTQTEKYNWLS